MIFGRRRRCPVQLCENRIPMRHICCNSCWALLPAGLRQAIETERHNCAAAHIEHSQELFALRDKAVAIASEINRDRFRRPDGEQLPLIA